MKSLIITIILFAGLQIFAQSVDITSSANFTPSPITVGGSSELTVTLSKLTIGVNLPVNTLAVEIKWGNGYLGNTPPTGSWASLFTWYYVPAPGYTFGGWYGINNIGPITEPAGTLSFPVSGVTPINNSGTQVQIQVNSPASDPIGGNNNSFAGLTVQTPLPVKLVSFESAIKNCEYIALDWTTASEINNAGFDVLRSYDKVNFEKIGFVEAVKGNRNNNYTFGDTNIVFKNYDRIYYLLNQKDLDGKNTFSNVISVAPDCKTKTSIRASPNPAIDKVNLSLSGFNEPTNVKFNILNQEGALVRTIELDSGTSFELFLNDFPPGVYHLQSIETGVSLSTKFIKIQ